MYGYGILGIGLAVAALLGQREAQVILFLWITWPILRGLFLAIPKVVESLRKRKEEKEDIIEAEAEVVDVEWEDNSQRRSLPRSTSGWRMVFATALAIVGGLLFLVGLLGALATLFR